MGGGLAKRTIRRIVGGLLRPGLNRPGTVLRQAPDAVIPEQRRAVDMRRRHETLQEKSGQQQENRQEGRGVSASRACISSAC